MAQSESPIKRPVTKRKMPVSEGSGAGWGLRPFDKAGEELEQKILKTLRVIEALNRLEDDFTSDKWFRELQKAMRGAYQAY